MKLKKEIERIGKVYRDSLAEFRLDEEQRMKMDCLFNNLVGDIKKEVKKVRGRERMKRNWPQAVIWSLFLCFLTSMYLLIYFTS